jgi:hypothetical protein
VSADKRPSSPRSSALALALLLIIGASSSVQSGEPLSFQIYDRIQERLTQFCSSLSQYQDARRCFEMAKNVNNDIGFAMHAYGGELTNILQGK